VEHGLRAPPDTRWESTRRRIRRSFSGGRDARQAVPAIAASCGAFHNRALAAGFDQHLIKPVNPKVLLAELAVTM
jgi:CheY-like chemotaxis protein